MSFLIYFFVLPVSTASVLFGLDLVSSTLPRTPNGKVRWAAAGDKAKIIHAPHSAAPKRIHIDDDSPN